MPISDTDLSLAIVSLANVIGTVLRDRTQR